MIRRTHRPDRKAQGDEELLLLQSIAFDLDHCHTLERALERVLRRVCESTGWALGEAWLPQTKGIHLLRGPAWHQRSARLDTFLQESRSFQFARGEGLPGRVWKSRKPLWIRDVRVDTKFPRAALAGRAGLKAGYAIPVLAGRKVVAVLNFFVLERRKRDLHLLRLVTAVAAQLGSIIRRALAEEALRVSRHTVAAQEAERRRLARELHDGVNQTLSSACFRLRVIEETGADSASLAQTRELVDRAIRDLRRICRNLGSSVVEDLGLGAAVARLLRDFEERTGTKVDFSGGRFPRRFEPEMGSSLYRIAQEGLANVERHARASKVSLRLWREGSQVGLTLKDDGVGFDTRRIRPLGDSQAGFGLKNVRERVEALGGEVGFASEPGKGTELRVLLPWRSRKA